MNIESIARSILPPNNLHFDDLISVGNLEIFKLGKKAASKKVIRGRMLNYLRDNCREKSDGSCPDLPPTWIDKEGRKRGSGRINVSQNFEAENEYGN